MKLFKCIAVFIYTLVVAVMIETRDLLYIKLAC